MAVNRSLGGIGKFYDGDHPLGEVYYNINLTQATDKMECSLVFVGSDVDLSHSSHRYRLILEDGRYLIVSITKGRHIPYAPYHCTSCDGVFHSDLFLVA